MDRIYRQLNADFEGKGIQPLPLSKCARKPALYKDLCSLFRTLTCCFCLRSAVVDAEFHSTYRFTLNNKIRYTIDNRYTVLYDVYAKGSCERRNKYDVYMKNKPVFQEKEVI